MKKLLKPTAGKMLRLYDTKSQPADLSALGAGTVK